MMARIEQRIDLPRISGIHLPEMKIETTKKDEFGFVFLEDGNVGPFYVSLTDSLQQLWQMSPEPGSVNLDTITTIQGFLSSEQAERALALGAINAVSQHVMRRAGFDVLAGEAEQSGSLGVCDPQPGEKVGMVGFFSPLVEKLKQQSIEVVVIEKQPERVESGSGVSLGKDIRNLQDCEHIICTASTLINQTLETVVEQVANAKTFNILGPSGSHCPDVLFNLGVSSVGGIQFQDIDRLKEALAEQASWGKLGNKYQLTPDRYPGLEVLLDSYQ